MLSRCYISCDESHPDISTVVNVGNMTYIVKNPSTFVVGAMRMRNQELLR